VCTQSEGPRQDGQQLAPADLRDRAGVLDPGAPDVTGRTDLTPPAALPLPDRDYETGGHRVDVQSSEPANMAGHVPVRVLSVVPSTFRRYGRDRPYSILGVRRLPCSRCGLRPSIHQWQVCSDNRLYRPLCLWCDIDLQAVTLQFMKDPDWMEKVVSYEIEQVEIYGHLYPDGRPPDRDDVRVVTRLGSDDPSDYRLR
jgi:hypothetical protein